MWLFRASVDVARPWVGGALLLLLLHTVTAEPRICAKHRQGSCLSSPVALWGDALARDGWV
eukprot:5573074-Prorocentrum_lima.AAC.1